MFCFTQNSIQKKKLQEIAVSFSLYKNPPNFEIPSIRKKLHQFFTDNLIEKKDEKNPTWYQHLNHEINQLNSFLDKFRKVTRYTLLKKQYSDKDFIDLFYILSASEERFISWKHRYSVWTKEIIFLWKKYLCQPTELEASIYIFGHQVFIFSELSESPSNIKINFKKIDQKEAFFLDATIFRVICYPDKTCKFLESQNLFEKILHDLDIMKQGLPCGISRLKNFKASIIKRNYYRMHDLLISTIKKIRYIDQSDNIFLKMISKISYFFNKSYLLTTKNKCSISIVKQS